jgi:hypothetical protein
MNQYFDEFTRFGLIASFIRTAIAPAAPRSSAVTGFPSLSEATTIRPKTNQVAYFAIDLSEFVYSLISNQCKPRILQVENSKGF